MASDQKLERIHIVATVELDVAVREDFLQEVGDDTLRCDVLKIIEPAVRKFLAGIDCPYLIRTQVN